MRSDDPRDTLREVIRDANRNFNRLLPQLTRELAKETPKDTGRASRGWNTVSRGDIIGTRSTQTVIRNDVDYVQYLNQGHSSQANAGYIAETINSVISRQR